MYLMNPSVLKLMSPWVPYMLKYIFNNISKKNITQDRKRGDLVDKNMELFWETSLENLGANEN